MLKFDEVKRAVANKANCQLNGICGDWKYEINVKECIYINLKNKKYFVNCKLSTEKFIRMNINEYVRFVNGEIERIVYQQKETQFKELENGQLQF